jgi:hypothetical protein
MKYFVSENSAGGFIFILKAVDYLHAEFFSVDRTGGKRFYL